MALRDLGNLSDAVTFEIISWVRWEIQETRIVAGGFRCAETPDLSPVYPNSSRHSPSAASLFCADYILFVTSPRHLVKPLDLYTKLSLHWQHWTDHQQHENENAPSVFVFLEWRFKDCVWYKLLRTLLPQFGLRPWQLVTYDKKYLNLRKTQWKCYTCC